MCKAKTTKGTKCKCTTLFESGYCYQHYHLYLVDKVEDFNQKKDEAVKKGI